MLKKILIAAVVLVAAFAAFVATRPDAYRVERSLSVAAAPDRIFPLVAELPRWAGWSPWEALDPAMKKEYAGEPGKPGSTYGWAGNDQVGEGRMTLLEAESPSRVSFRLEFLKPYQSVATTAFRLSPGAAGTTVTWEIEGRLGFLEKLVGLFMDMNGMVAADFDRGLVALKAVAERPEAPADAPATGPSKG